MKEKTIENQIKTYLSSLGGYVLKGDNNNISGTPDIICCLRSKFIAIEVKLPNQAPRLNQINNISNIRKSQGVAFYATSLNQVIDTLKKLKLL
jgi:Holliday junction resolvase